MWTNFKCAKRAVTMHAGQFIEFVRNNPGAQAALLAFAGDMLVPLFRDGWSYGATASFCLGEAGLFAFSKNPYLKRNPWMPAASYTLFAIGMELLTHSIGVAHNPLLRLNLLAFSRLDVIWVSQYALRATGIAMRKRNPQSSAVFVAGALKSKDRKTARIIYKIGSIGSTICGVGATLLHFPGIGGSLGLSGPFNGVTLGGHSCWLVADCIMGNVQKVGRLIGRGAKRTMRGPELMTLGLR